MATQGLTKVVAMRKWLMVARIHDNITHMTWYPNMSIIKPNIGDSMADNKYTML